MRYSRGKKNNIVSPMSKNTIVVKGDGGKVKSKKHGAFSMKEFMNLFAQHVASKPSTKGKKKKKRNRKKRGGSSKSGGSGTLDILSNAVLAQLNPAAVPRCTARSLLNPRAAQPVSAIGRLNSITIASGKTMVFAVAPNFASDTSQVSIFGYVVSTAAINNNNWVLGTCSPASGAGTFPTGVDSGFWMATATPYSFATLSGDFYNVKFVSGHLSLKNNSAEMNRGGRLLCLEDLELQLASEYENLAGANSLTANNVYNIINSSSKTREVPFLTEASCVYNGSDYISGASFSGVGSGVPGVWTSGNQVNGYNTTNGNWTQVPFGNDGISTLLTAGQPIGYGMYSNTSGQTQDVSMSWLEHWEVNAQQLSALHQPAIGGANVHSAVSSLISTCKSQHAMMPQATMGEVAKHVSGHPHVKASFHGVEAVMEKGIKLAQTNLGKKALTGMSAMLLA